MTSMLNSKVFDVIKERSSVREYSGKPVEQEKLDLIMEAARLAPSASNSQPWHFYVVKNKEFISRLAEKMPMGSSVVINSFIKEAPVVVVATAGPIDLLHKALAFVINKRWYYLDVAIALEHMALTARDLGIGSCWIGWFDEKKIKTLLGIPAGQEVVAMLTLGYPKYDKIGVKVRKDPKEIFKVID